jgi:branched-chain amino acid transport system permease protein
MNRAEMFKFIVCISAIIAAIAVPVILSSIYWTSVLTMIVINTLMTTSLRNISLMGEFSLGHVGFMCLGAYTSALLTMKTGLPFVLALLAAGLMSGLLAFALGYPFMRVKGIYFVVLTLMTAESIRRSAYYWKGLTGGVDGLIGFPGAGVLSIPGLGQIDFNGYTEYYYLTLTVVCASLFLLYRLEKSKLGFTWMAIRDSDRMAGSVGVNILRYKVICFTVSCFFAGLAGSLFADFEQALGAQDTAYFGVLTSIYFLIYMVVGGKTRFAGPIVGAVVLSLVSEFTRPVEEYQSLVIGAIAIGIVMIIPDGIISIPEKIRKWRKGSPA